MWRKSKSGYHSGEAETEGPPSTVTLPSACARPDEILASGRRHVLVHEGDIPLGRKRGRDQQKPLRRHESAHPRHQRVSVVQRPERPRVAGKDAEDAAARPHLEKDYLARGLTVPSLTYPIKVLTPRGVCLPQMKRGSEDLIFREFVPRQRNSRRKVDDPRGKNTGTPSSGAVSGSGAWQRQPGLSGAGDLAVAVLPLEEEVRSIRSGGVAPAPAGVPARAAAEGGGPRGTSCPGHGSGLADVGSSTALGPASAKFDTGGTEHDPSTPSTHRAWKSA